MFSEDGDGGLWGVGGGIAGLSGFSVAVGCMEPRKSGTFF